MLRVAIIGSRSAPKEIIEKIKKALPRECTTIISGGAVGADELAKTISEELEISIFNAIPQYKKFGRIAPIIRNKLIVEMADLVIAVWDTKSKGTEQVIKYAKQTNTDVYIITF